MTNQEQIINHLEYLGYSMEISNVNNDWIMGTKSGYPFIMVKVSDDGIRVSSYYNTNQNVKSEDRQFLEYLNELNSKSGICTFYTNEDLELNFSCSYMGLYDKNRFSFFINLWEYDVTTIMDSISSTMHFLYNSDEITPLVSEGNTNAYA